MEALPKKGDEVRTPSGGRWFEKSDSVVFVCESDGKWSKVGLEMAKRCSWKGSGERYEIRETQETAGNEAQRGEVL